MAIKCNIITDSPCDLSHDYCAENNVRVIHFSYTEMVKEDDKGKSREPLVGVDDMFYETDSHEFYKAIKDGACPMTSQPSQGEIEILFREIIETGIPTVYLCFSSGISGCYNGSLAVLDRLKEELGEDIPLYIVDLKMGSTPQSLFVAEAVRQRDRGLSAEELVRWANEAKWFVHTVFMVDDLQALKRGGRIPSGVAMAGSLLDVKPLLTFDLDGRLAMLGVCRGRKKAMRKMARIYEKEHAAASYGPVCAIGNADCEKDMRKFQEMILKDDETVVFMETTIGPTIGCHVGPGMLSCCFWGSDRRDDKSVADKIADDTRSE